MFLYLIIDDVLYMMSVIRRWNEPGYRCAYV